MLLICCVLVARGMHLPIVIFFVLFSAKPIKGTHYHNVSGKLAKNGEQIKFGLLLISCKALLLQRCSQSRCWVGGKRIIQLL